MPKQTNAREVIREFRGSDKVFDIDDDNSLKLGIIKLGNQFNSQKANAYVMYKDNPDEKYIGCTILGHFNEDFLKGQPSIGCTLTFDFSNLLTGIKKLSPVVFYISNGSDDWSSATSGESNDYTIWYGDNKIATDFQIYPDDTKGCTYSFAGTDKNNEDIPLFKIYYSELK